MIHHSANGVLLLKLNLPLINALQRQVMRPSKNHVLILITYSALVHSVLESKTIANL